MDGLPARSQIQTFLDLQPLEFPRLGEEVETAVFRIVQEALTNVFRHSGARRGWVSIVQRDGRVEIAVRDDGKGGRGPPDIAPHIRWACCAYSVLGLPMNDRTRTETSASISCAGTLTQALVSELDFRCSHT